MYSTNKKLWLCIVSF